MIGVGHPEFLQGLIAREDAVPEGGDIDIVPVVILHGMPGQERLLVAGEPGQRVEPVAALRKEVITGGILAVGGIVDPDIAVRRLFGHDLAVRLLVFQ